MAGTSRANPRVVRIVVGNSGYAVALAAKTAGQNRNMSINATVVFPDTSLSFKIQGAENNGAGVVLAGSNPEGLERTTKDILKRTGAIFVGSDDPHIVHGQTTTTMEMVEQVKDMSGHELDAVVLPSANGGLLAGAAIFCKNTDTSVFGCEPRVGGPELNNSIRSGILSHPEIKTALQMA